MTTKTETPAVPGHHQRPAPDGPTATYARSVPPGGRRWRQLAEFDERVAQLDKRTVALADERAALEEQGKLAVVADREALASWIADSAGIRPEPTAPRYERRLAETEANREALSLATEKALAEKVKFVVRHRGRLLRDARKEKERALAGVEQLIAALEQARAEAVELLRLEGWTKHFPSQEASADPLSGFARGGRVIGALPEANRARLGIGQLYAALREDAAWIAVEYADTGEDSSGPDIRKQAVWKDTKEGVEAFNREQKRALAALTPKNVHTAGWGEN